MNKTKKITIKYFKSKHYKLKHIDYNISRDYKNNCLIIISYNNYILENYNSDLFNYEIIKLSKYGIARYKTIITLK